MDTPYVDIMDLWLMELCHLTSLLPKFQIPTLFLYILTVPLPIYICIICILGPIPSYRRRVPCLSICRQGSISWGVIPNFLNGIISQNQQVVRVLYPGIYILSEDIRCTQVHFTSKLLWYSPSNRRQGSISPRDIHEQFISNILCVSSPPIICRQGSLYMIHSMCLHCESAAICLPFCLSICCNFQSVFALTSSVSMSYMFCSTFLHWHCILVSGTEREINHNVFLYPVYSVTPHLVFWWPPTSYGWHPIFALIVIVTFVILWNGPHATILVVWWWIVNHSVVRVFLL